MIYYGLTWRPATDNLGDDLVALAAMQRDWIELLPVAGGLLQTGGLWCEQEQNIRKFGLSGAPFWLIYNFISRAYGAALGSLIVMISIVISMVRYRKKKSGC